MNLALIQIKNLINEALSQIAQLEAANDGKLTRCPNCLSTDLMKRGYTEDKRHPRYRCNNQACSTQTFTIPTF